MDIECLGEWQRFWALVGSAASWKKKGFYQGYEREGCSKQMSQISQHFGGHSDILAETGVVSQSLGFLTISR